MKGTFAGNQRHSRKNKRSSRKTLTLMTRDWFACEMRPSIHATTSYLPFSKTVLDMLQEIEQTCRRSGKLAEAPRSSERLREASGSFPKPSEAARSYTKETGFDTNSPCVARRLEEVCANKSSTKLRETPEVSGSHTLWSATACCATS